MIKNPFKGRYKLLYDLIELAGAKEWADTTCNFFFKKQHEFFFDLKYVVILVKSRKPHVYLDRLTELGGWILKEHTQRLVEVDACGSGVACYVLWQLAQCSGAYFQE